MQHGGRVVGAVSQVEPCFSHIEHFVSEIRQSRVLLIACLPTFEHLLRLSREQRQRAEGQLETRGGGGTSSRRTKESP